MTRGSRSLRRVADVVGGSFGRLAAIIIGFVLMAAGLGMTATIVMLPIGIVVGLVGLGILVAGFFAPDERGEPLER